MSIRSLGTMKKLLAAGAAIALVAGAAQATVLEFSGPYTAKVRCHGINEDRARTLELVKYQRNDDGTVRLVYRCTR